MSFILSYLYTMAPSSNTIDLSMDIDVPQSNQYIPSTSPSLPSSLSTSSTSNKSSSSSSSKTTQSHKRTRPQRTSIKAEHQSTSNGIHLSSTPISSHKHTHQHTHTHSNNTTPSKMKR